MLTFKAPKTMDTFLADLTVVFCRCLLIASCKPLNDVGGVLVRVPTYSNAEKESVVCPNF